MRRSNLASRCGTRIVLILNPDSGKLNPEAVRRPFLLGTVVQLSLSAVKVVRLALREVEAC